MLHWLAHLFGWNGCRIIDGAAEFPDGRDYILLQCAKCGKVKRGSRRLYSRRELGFG